MHTTISTAEMRLAPPAQPLYVHSNSDMGNPLHHAINMLRSINAAKRLTPAVLYEGQQAGQYHGMPQFAARWCTVTCAAGRDTGHTSYILEHAQANDLIIIGHGKNRQPYRGSAAQVAQASYHDIPNTAGRTYDTIYVDDATSMLSQVPLELVYAILARNKDQTFILLG